MKARTIGAALGAAGMALTLAACGSSGTKAVAPARTPSMATATPAGSSSGTITIRGKEVLTGKAAGQKVIPPLPVQVTGLVTDHGHLSLGGKTNGTSVIALADGGLQVHHKGKNEKGHFVKGTCTFTNASAGKFTVLPGGTGAYKGAHGHGVFTVIFTEVAKRNAKGQCMTGKKVNPKSLTVEFKARGPLTLAH